MKIKLLPVESLIPYARNPRNNAAAVDKVAASIKEYGWQQPIVVDSEMVIIVGHTRLLAAKKLGLEKVPVKIADTLTDEQIKAYRLADNRTGEIAVWDTELLKLELNELESLDPDFDADSFGFSEEELEALEDSLAENNIIELPSEPADDPNSAPALPLEPLTKPGDLYEIGSHRLYCGNSTLLDHFETLMGEQKAQLIVTDPPYNIDYTGKTKDALKIQNDKMSGESFKDFLIEVFTNLLMSASEGAGIYIFHADSEGVNFRQALTESGFLLKQCLIWNKHIPTLGRQDYQWQHEPILYGWKPGAAHNWYSDRKQTTVWNFNKPTRSAEHPTMKPIDLIQYPIENSSKPDDLVLDAFGGSGSTMVAAHQTGRRCYTMEIDPHYCDVIVTRMRKLWPDLLILRNGKVFNDVA